MQDKSNRKVVNAKLKMKDLLQCGVCGAIGDKHEAIDKGLCHKPTPKLGKKDLRIELEKLKEAAGLPSGYGDGFYRASNEEIDALVEFIQTQISLAKQQGYAEAVEESEVMNPTPSRKEMRDNRFFIQKICVDCVPEENIHMWTSMDHCKCGFKEWKSGNLTNQNDK